MFSLAKTKKKGAFQLPIIIRVETWCTASLQHRIVTV